MRQEPPRFLQVIAKVFALETLETLPTEINPRFDQFDVRSFFQGVGNDSFVLVYCYGAGGVDYVTAWFDRVDRTEDELFLQMRKKDEISCCLSSPKFSLSYIK